mgnify:CR=1 FL=1|jgi:hypothetical protein
MLSILVSLINSGMLLFIVCVTIGLLALSWAIMIYSKVYFKKAFSNKFWKVAFMIVIGLSSVVHVFISEKYMIESISHLNEVAAGYAIQFYLFNILVFPVLSIFFICYLINFMIRFVHNERL